MYVCIEIYIYFGDACMSCFCKWCGAIVGVCVCVCVYERYTFLFIFPLYDHDRTYILDILSVNNYAHR